MTGVGSRVRTLLEVLADDGYLLPIGSSGTVVGYEGDKLVVTFEDRDTDTSRTATAEVWELLRLGDRQGAA